MPFGSFPSNSPTPAFEIYFAIVGAQLNATETYFNVGSYTMRWPGHLYVDLHAQVRWPGGSTLPSGAGLYLSVTSNSTPAPGSAADLGVIADAAGIFDAQQELRTHGAWYNLAAGQTVTCVARVWSNVLGNLVNVIYLGGNFRPTAI